MIDADRASAGFSSLPAAASTRAGSRASVVVVYTAIAVAFLVGTALRAWFLFHLPLNSDQAVVGLMANHYLHGHFTAFYWGQQYGGVEPYVVAAAFRVAGHSATTLNVVPVALWAGAAVLVWRITRRLVDDPKLALLSGALAWAAPLPAIYKSTDEYGLRSFTLVCGLAIVLIALRLRDGEQRRRMFLLFGLLVGLGWWSLPEIVYFLVPASLLVVGAAMHFDRDGRWWATRFGISGAGFVVGAFPWLWSNLQSGLASLNSSKFAGTASPLNTGYRGRLGIFFRYAMPLQLDLRPVSLGFGNDSTSKWIIASPAGVAHGLMAILLVATIGGVGAAIVLCVVRGGRSAAIAGALIALPFLTALQPGTWYWQDGRYLVYLGPLLAIALGVACQEVDRRLARTRWSPRGHHAAGRFALGAVVAFCVVVTLASFRESAGVGPSAFLDNWRHPDRPAQAVVSSLRAQDIHFAYANYWVAYKLDFVSREQLIVTVGSTETDRSPDFDARVRHARHPAWLFVPPSQMGNGFDQFGATANIQGPDGISEANFTTRLQELHIAYRVVSAGLLDAVVPSRPVTFTEIAASG